MITDDLIGEAMQRLIEAFDPDRIIVFGSHAWGQPTDHSDLDLMVVVPSSDQPQHLRAIQAQQALGDLPIAVDVFVKTRSEFALFRDLPSSLEHLIAHRGLIAYDRSRNAARPELAIQSTE
jgi:predicted nucleotidyltransferase